MYSKPCEVGGFFALNIRLDIKEAYRYNKPKYFSEVEC